MLGRDYTGQNCSVARALEVIGERWTLVILRDAFLGLSRFEQFQQRLGLAPNILTKRLRTLTDAGILERRRYQERPERFEYVLTDAGKELFPVLVGLMRWGDAHLAPKGPPILVVHVACGGGIDASSRCDRCGDALGPDNVEWYFGPGSTKAGPMPRPPLGAPSPR